MKKSILSVSFTMVLLLSCLMLASAAPAEKSVTEIFVPQTSWWEPGLQYARIIELQHNGSLNGTLLATCEKTGIDNRMTTVSFPIFRSTDGGSTWQRISDVTTSELGGMRWEPQLFELDRDLGSVKKGTILCSGLAIENTNGWRNGKIKLFKSTDGGVSWTFMSNIASGGDDKHGIWEPFFIIDGQNRLICYYSDCREYETHSQKLVHQVSTDGGYTWGPVVDDVAVEQRDLRPGMPVVSKMGNGKYIMTYEVVTEDKPHTGNPVYYRFSNDGHNWGDPQNLGTKLVTSGGTVPGSSPYNVYTPLGGEKGMVIVTSAFQTPSTASGGDLFVNYNYGNGPWERLSQPLKYTYGGYSHGMALSADGSRLFMVNNTDYKETNDKQLTKLVFSYIQLAEPRATQPSASASSATSSKSSAQSNAGGTSASTLPSSSTTLIGDATDGTTGSAIGTQTADSGATTGSKGSDKSDSRDISPLLIIAAGVLGLGVAGEATFIVYKLMKKKP